MRQPRPDQRARTRLLLLWMAIVPATAVVAIVFLLLIGDRYPRAIAPGASLALPGLGASGVMGLPLLVATWRRWHGERLGTASVLLYGLTSLLTWPIWAVGLMPSINGMAVEPASTTRMRIVALDTTSIANSIRRRHWATLSPTGDASRRRDGRYFIAADRYDRWVRDGTDQTIVTHATGLLGAEIILSLG